RNVRNEIARQVDRVGTGRAAGDVRGVPSNPLLHGRLDLTVARLGFHASIISSLLLCSCAKFPSNGASSCTKRVIFTMTTAAPINPNYVYIVALHASEDVNPTTQGPIPIISQPWGNGFVAGTVDLFVRWDPLTSPNYLIYRFQDVNLTQYIQVGVPVNSTPVNTGDNKIQFELDINQIAASI